MKLITGSKLLKKTKAEKEVAAIEEVSPLEETPTLSQKEQDRERAASSDTTDMTGNTNNAMS